MTPNDRITVAVTGACGRMGRMIIDNVTQAPDMTLVAAFDKQSCNSDVINASNLAETLKSVRPDVLVDFTVAASSVEIIKKSRRRWSTTRCRNNGIHSRTTCRSEESDRRPNSRDN